MLLSQDLDVTMQDMLRCCRFDALAGLREDSKRSPPVRVSLVMELHLQIC